MVDEAEPAMHVCDVVRSVLSHENEIVISKPVNSTVVLANKNFAGVMPLLLLKNQTILLPDRMILRLSLTTSMCRPCTWSYMRC